MSKRTFEVTFSKYGIEIGEAIIELNQKVIDVVDDDWRAHLYDLHTPEEIAAHIAWNMQVNNLQLSDLDGWADQPNSNAKMLEWAKLDDYDMEAQEMGP